ncbi:NosD domain-containing protein [Halorussus halophilus]|uniref:NosD domain-containing protein n=1 Tax=Halorussus halophilus TaxID=2650975 RepID=UPI0013014D24|nr:right-handed parallel beta-helix repeat-containing protein [Halorussus halophilus]
MSISGWRLVVVVGVVVLTAAAVAVGVSGVGVSTPSMSNASPSPTSIDACTTITSPGTYELSRDVATRTRESCIDIRADDVELDGAGHAIDGRSLRDSSTAVVVGAHRTRSNVTVRNIEVRNWVYGVSVVNASETTVEGVRTSRTVEGVTVENSSDVTVADSTISNGFVGISVVHSRRVAVRKTVVETQASIGFSVIDSTDVAITNSSGRSNHVGVALFDTTRVHVIGATITESSAVGVTVRNTRQTRISESRLDNAGVTTTTMSGRVPRRYTSRDLALRNSARETVRNLSLAGTTVSLSGDDLLLTGTSDTSERDESDDASDSNANEWRPVTDPVTVTPYGSDSRLWLTVQYSDAAVREAKVEEESLRVLECRDDDCSRTTGEQRLSSGRNAVSVEGHRIDHEVDFLLVGVPSRRPSAVSTR